jgi:hypothetical protein
MSMGNSDRLTNAGGFVRRVSCLTASVVGVVAVLAWVVWDAGEALGAVVGGVLTIANFLWLRWAVGVALPGNPTAPRGAGRRLFWLVASGARFGVVAFALATAITQGWVGLGGLAVALMALPVTVVAEGLRAARVG